jgi:acyl carrier protein phosphodiesterase
LNFLAHLFLAQPDEDLMLGNFIADAVKGQEHKKYSDRIAEGILMHRAIDNFTDRHECFRKTTSLLMPSQGKYAGVVADVLYDHFLARNWTSYHHQDLAYFTNEVYRLIESKLESLPVKTQYMFPYMKEHNWLLNYAEFTGVERALTGMSKRSKYPNNMSIAIEDLQLHYKEMHEHFTQFFEEAKMEFSKWGRGGDSFKG